MLYIIIVNIYHQPSSYIFCFLIMKKTYTATLTSSLNSSALECHRRTCNTHVPVSWSLRMADVERSELKWSHGMTPAMVGRACCILHSGVVKGLGQPTNWNEVMREGQARCLQVVPVFTVLCELVMSSDNLGRCPRGAICNPWPRIVYHYFSTCIRPLLFHRRDSHMDALLEMHYSEG